MSTSTDTRPQRNMPRATLVSVDNLSEEEVHNMNQAVAESVYGVHSLPVNGLFLVIDDAPRPGSAVSDHSDDGFILNNMFKSFTVGEIKPITNISFAAHLLVQAMNGAVELVWNIFSAVNNCIARNMRKVIRYVLQCIPERMVPVNFYVFHNRSSPECF